MSLFRGLAVALGVAAALLVLPVVVAIQTDLAPPPFAYSQQLYPAEPPDLCPGDEFTVRAVIDIKRTPVTVERTTTIWSIALGLTVVPGKPEFLNWLPGDEGPHDQIARYTVPYGLAPGHYELRATGQAEGSKIEFYRVKFRVKNNCPKGGT